MTVNALSAASIAIYVIFLQPTLYVFYKHGWPGFLGWFYLHVFILVRIIGNGLSIHSSLHPVPLIGGTTAPGNNKATLIVNNIGLSPLLLAAAGVLHEARRARRANGSSSTFEWILVGQYHLLVSGGVRVDCGRGDIIGGGESQVNLHTAQAVMKAGAAVVVICWVLLAAGTGISVFGGRGQHNVALDWKAGSLVSGLVFLCSVVRVLIWDVGLTNDGV